MRSKAVSFHTFMISHFLGQGETTVGAVTGRAVFGSLVLTSELLDRANPSMSHILLAMDAFSPAWETCQPLLWSPTPCFTQGQRRDGILEVTTLIPDVQTGGSLPACWAASQGKLWEPHCWGISARHCFVRENASLARHRARH